MSIKLWSRAELENEYFAALRRIEVLEDDILVITAMLSSARVTVKGMTQPEIRKLISRTRNHVRISSM
jgi:hypothetical protein